MNTNLRPALALAAMLAIGAPCTTPAHYAFAAELPSAGSALLGPEPGAVAAGAPRAEVADPVYNFGTALSGPPISHVFMLKNVGDAPLEIKSVNSSCGCTAAKPSKTILAPGEVSTITASVDTHFEQGHSLSVVTLITNDPANASLQLKIEGVIKPQVAARPMDVDFGSVHHGSAEVREVVISDMVGGAGFAVKSVKNESPYIKVTESARTDGKPGALLHVALLPSMPPGPISDTLRIETSRAPLRVAILGVVTGDLVVKPNQISFGILAHDQGAVRIVRLTNQGSHSINVLGVDSTSNSVVARVAPVTPGKEYKLTVALRPNTPDGQIRGALTIRTDDPQQTTLTVPYYGIVGSFRS
ncbi:MAG TPA: DUF1573 domain-containing protein [Candidatus Binataceae bacterium]|nr:DUF1573 domain-containing protein [Candidatus Binataceae bacterium]